MTQTEEKTLFSHEKAINCFIIASSYIAARAIFFGQSIAFTNYGACLNPAVAAGIDLASLFGQGASSLKYIWLYPVVPFGGSIIAVIFYELVFKKT